MLKSVETKEFQLVFTLLYLRSTMYLYKKKIEGYDMNNPVSAFIELFENLPDKRQPGKVKRRLVDIIFIAIVGTIVG